MPALKLIYLGIGGSVVALDAASGRQVWAKQLKGSGFVNLVTQGGSLYAAAAGEIFCLDPTSGDTKWHNPLTGFGTGLVSIATEADAASAQSILMAEMQRREGQAAAGST